MTITNVKWANSSETSVLVDFDDGSRITSGVKVASDINTIANGPTRRAVKVWVDLGNTPQAADPVLAPLTPRQQIIAKLRADPVLKAQVIDSFEARGITDKQLMLDALEAKFAEPI